MKTIQCTQDMFMYKYFQKLLELLLRNKLTAMTYKN